MTVGELLQKLERLNPMRRVVVETRDDFAEVVDCDSDTLIPVGSGDEEDVVVIYHN